MRTGHILRQDAVESDRGGLANWWSVALLLLVLCGLSYGSFLPWLGYYWDDWPVLFVARTFGGEGLQTLFAGNRPLTAWSYALLTHLIGFTPWRWHVLILGLRWLSAVACWWSLRAVWPQQPLAVFAIAALVAVYPGFTQQPVAFTYSVHFLSLALWYLSLGAMLWGVRTPRWFWPLTGLALISDAASLIVLDYYVGLELLRPVLLWLVLHATISGRRWLLLRTLRAWAPYAMLLGGFFLWRAILFTSTRQSTNPARHLQTIFANPLQALGDRLLDAVTDIIEAPLMVWGQTFLPDLFDFGSRSVWLAWALGIGSAGLLLWSMRGRAWYTAGEVDGSAWSLQALGVGLIAMIVGELPIWYINVSILLNTNHDRFTLPAMLGGCMVLVGGIYLLLRTPRQRCVLVSLLVGLAISFHCRNANRYRRDWQVQREFFWQLSWRVPGLTPGTAVLIENPPLVAPSRDYAIAIPVNLLYAPAPRSLQMDYWAFNLTRQLGRDIPVLAEHVSLHDSKVWRPLAFSGSTAQALVVWFAPPACLRVLDPHDAMPPQLPAITRLAAQFASVAPIIARPQHPAHPPEQLLGPEPPRHWCYYFQRADLARQQEDWQEVVRLGDQLRHEGWQPQDATEWQLFIDGYKHVGRLDAARALAEQAMQALVIIPPTLREFWKQRQAQ